MPWPTPQDYNEAIQSPQFNFSDPELKSGKPDLNQLGLPRPITGGFASVYRMRCAQKDWAVRCFLREFADQQQRYAAISKRIIEAKLSYTVGFEFLSQGIRVQGKWYPILKMEWVEGDLLNDYIRKHLHNQSTLFGLANRWISLVKGLQAANVAHGDLQHGNILVVNGDFRLIDYDGMFVPALAGQSSHEVGHRNYQHPLRTESDFGPYLDYFAAWVIYISLASLSIDPMLWQRVGAGDEFILFRKEDFDSPDTSSTFALLTKHRDSRIQSLATIFQSLLYLSPMQIPALDGQPELSIQPTMQAVSSGIDWLADHIKVAPGLSSSESSSQIAGSITDITLPFEKSTWVLDFISQPPAINLNSFGSSAKTLRIIALVSVSVLSIFIVLMSFSVIQAMYLILSVIAPLVVLNVITLVAFYRRDPIVREMYELLTRKNGENQLLVSIQQSVKKSTDEKTAVGKEESEKKKGLSKQRTDVQERERRENNKVQSELKRALDSINARRLAINREEADALRKSQDNIGYALPGLNRQISLLAQAEADNLAQALQLIQKMHLDAYLKRQHLAAASIPGIGPKLLGRLKASGVYTAAESEYWKVKQVEGIGENKARAIHFWREGHLLRAQLEMPKTLSQSDVSTIKAKYETQRHQLEKQRDEIQQRLKTEEIRLREHFTRSRQPLSMEQLNTQTKANNESQEIARRYAQEYASIAQAEVRLTAKYRENYQKIDEQIAQMRKQLFEIHWRLAIIRRELMSFQKISFENYMRLVLLGRRALKG